MVSHASSICSAHAAAACNESDKLHQTPERSVNHGIAPVCGMSERQKFPWSTAAIAAGDRPLGDCCGSCCAYATASYVARFRPVSPKAAAGTFCYGSYTSAASTAKLMATRYKRSITSVSVPVVSKAKRPHAIIDQIISYVFNFIQRIQPFEVRVYSYRSILLQ